MFARPTRPASVFESHNVGFSPAPQQVQGFDLGRKRGHPFFLVFAYPPGNPVLYKGDMESIRDFTETAPTHHGFAIAYRGGHWVNAPSGHHVVLLGRNTFHRAQKARKRNYLDMKFIDGHSHKDSRDKFYNGRRTFCLFLYQFSNATRHMILGSQPTLLFRWRRLPKAYLKQLAEADEILDAEE
jgi:hypothetical protein